MTGPIPRVRLKGGRMTDIGLHQIRYCRRSLLRIAKSIAFLSFALCLAGPLSAQLGSGRSEPGTRVPNRQVPFPQPAPEQIPEKNQKQKDALLKYNFSKLKKHADELAELAHSLQKKIDQSNQNVLSLDVVRDAEEIEKLAKKIKNEAKGD